MATKKEKDEEIQAKLEATKKVKDLKFDKAQREGKLVKLDAEEKGHAIQNRHGYGDRGEAR
jgi:hypothetical protein